MKLNCLIVDDEPVAQKLLKEYADDVDFIHIAGVAENPVKAKTALQEQKIDLIFLDINMPKMSGIEFLRSQRDLPLTILTTAYPDYTLEGFELDVLDYLVKPFSAARFLNACTKALEYAELLDKANRNQSGNQSSDHFFVKCNGIFEKIYFEELMYVEAMQNYVVMHTSNSRKLTVYLTFKSVLEQLPADTFIKIHKSTIVNIGKVKSIDGNTIHLGKVSLTISQNLQEEVLNAIVKRNLLKR